MNIFKVREQYDLKKAFTLIEVMLLLVVLSLVFASSTTIITRKHKLKPRRSVHGTYICYRNRDDGLLHEIMYSGKSLLYENNQTINPAFTECRFEAPKTASYLYVQIIGGGGAGGNANQSVSTTSSWTGLNNTTEGSNNQNSTTYASVLSFLKDNTTTGLTEDYIHGFKFDEVRLSVRWFRKFLKDNNIKLVLYDYAGNGAPGGDYEQNYLKTSDYEKADDEPEDTYYWYESYCQYSLGSTTKLAPEKCLTKLKANYQSFAADAASSLMLPYATYTDVAGTGRYCQQRPPIYKNCPWLQAKYWPRTYTYKCDGGLGGQGGLIASPVVDFDLGYSYQLGKRVAKTPSGDVDLEKTIDWSDPELNDPAFDHKYKGKGTDCLVAPSVGIDYALSSPGELLTYDEACPDGTTCTDIEGMPIQYPQKTADGYIASAYYDTNIGSTPIRDYWGSLVNSLYFKKYPVVVLTRSYNPEGCIQKGTKAYGATRGLDGGLPYFENALGVKNGEGIKLCKDGVCTLYSTTNSQITGSSSFVAGKGGLGAYTIGALLDDDLTLADAYDGVSNVSAYCASRTTVEPSGLQGAGGSTTMNRPSGTNYMVCSGPYAIAYGPTTYSSANNSYFFNSGSYYSTSYYSCPDSRHSGHRQKIGLTLAHYLSQLRLYYGEKGSAGSYKTLFARSFGTTGLKLSPGRGGTARPISSGNTLPGNNGEATYLGTECDELGENCGVTVVASGGLGGRAHISEDYSYIPMTNKDIYDYAHDPSKAPEPKYTQNYLDNSYIGEDSDFQQVSFLSDLSMIENGEVVSLIGKGGNAGWVKHNCFLRPQYFSYHYRGYAYTYYPSSYNVEIPNIDGDEYTPAGSTYDDWEGYTNFSQAIINNLEVCRKGGKSPENQYEETQATNGYPGAIVIMW